jgi:hypothetical protein
LLDLQALQSVKAAAGENSGHARCSSCSALPLQACSKCLVNR